MTSALSPKKYYASLAQELQRLRMYQSEHGLDPTQLARRNELQKLEKAGLFEAHLSEENLLKLAKGFREQQEKEAARQPLGSERKV